MIDNKRIDKIAIALIVVAVILVGVFTCYGFSSKSTGLSRNGMNMTYEKTLFDDEPMTINIEMDDDQWQDLLDNATSEEYYSADVTVNGTKYSKVGVRAKGNTSLSQVASSESDRYSLKIKFDEYMDGQTCDGLSKLVLNNNYSDATMMKEAICYDMFAFLGADASLYNYAKVSVNGEYTGLYLALEPVEESFCERVYGTNYGKLYKPDSMEMGGGKGNMKDFDMDKFKEKFEGDQSDSDSDTKQNSESKMSNAKNDNQQNDSQEPPEKPSGEQGDMQNPPEMPNGEQGGGPGGQQGGQPGGQQGDMQEPPEMPNGEQGGGSGGQQGDPQGEQGGGPQDNKNSNGADLNYSDDNTDSYETIWDGAVFDCKVADKKSVIAALKVLCDTDSNYEKLSQYIDVENMAKYMAVHTFSVNLDSLSGNMTHNYYLYEDGGMLNLIPWDYNLAFGGFQSGNASGTINFSISWPFSNMDEEDRQLFANLLNCDEFKEMYYANLKKLAQEYVLGGKFSKKVSSLRNQIDSLVKTDPTSFYTYSEYQSAQKTFKKVVTLRAKSVLAQIKSEGATVDASGIDLTVMGEQNHGDKK